MATNNAINTSPGTAPLFHVVLSSTVNSVTGDGTPYTIQCDDVLIDQSESYDPDTGVFVAPISGNYMINAQVLFQTNHGGLDVTFNLESTGSTYSGVIDYPTNLVPSDLQPLSINTLIPMNQGDTLKMVVTSFGGSKADSVIGASIGSRVTFFSGYLIG